MQLNQEILESLGKHCMRLQGLALYLLQDYGIEFSLSGFKKHL